MNNKEINWDKMPRGATHYSLANDENFFGWWRMEGGNTFCICEEGDVFAWEIGHFDDTVELLPIHKEKPWVPEVGVECEVSNCGNEFVRCIPRYIGEVLHVVDHEHYKEQHYYVDSVKFRPIKTKLDEKALSQAIFEAARDSGESEVWREILSIVADNLSENHIGWDREKFVEFGALPADWRKK